MLSQRDQAELSKELSTLRFDVPLPLSFEELVRQEPDHDRLARFYERMGFSTLLDGLRPRGARGESAEVEGPSPGSRLEVEVELHGLPMQPQRVYAELRRVLPEDHPSVGLTLTQLGTALADAGDFGEAETTLREALRALPDTRFNIEVKSPDPKLVDATVEVLRDEGAVGRVVVGSAAFTSDGVDKPFLREMARLVRRDRIVIALDTRDDAHRKGLDPEQAVEKLERVVEKASRLPARPIVLAEVPV